MTYLPNQGKYAEDSKINKIRPGKTNQRERRGFGKGSVYGNCETCRQKHVKLGREVRARTRGQNVEWL